MNGVPVDKVQRAGSDSEGDSGLESGSGEVGFDWDWPPWKNIPRRYKLIGTTSLAFVICNMDKVVLALLLTLLLFLSLTQIQRTSTGLEFSA